MSPVWLQIILYVCGFIVGIIVNTVIVSRIVGRYEERMETLGRQMDDHKREIHRLNFELAKLGTIFAAYTGIVNGVDYKKGG